MYQTTNERLDAFESKLDKALAILTPEQATKPENAELFAKLDELSKQIASVKTGNASVSSEFDIEEENSPKFERNMWNYAALGFLASAILTAITYKLILFFFPLAFSLFFAFSLIGLGLLHDKYILPGNTIRRIASNAISASIFWLAFTIASVAGFSIGNTIISDPFGGEEGSAKQANERYIDNPAPRYDSDTIQLGGGETER